MSLDINPYEVLDIDTKADLKQIKKAYRLKCLKYHPDKYKDLDEEETKQNKSIFEQIQFAHSILTNESKRKRYDKYGSLDDNEIDDSFDWFEYFQKNKVEITEQVIEKDKVSYQGSLDEKEDIINSWNESDGEFLTLFETIPHTRVDKKEEERLYKIVEELISADTIEISDDWKVYVKNRKKLFNKYKRSQKDESKEVEELRKEIFKEKDLKQLIQKNGESNLNNLISKLENKYGKDRGKDKGKKKGTKKKKSEYEIDDEEFERIQKKLKR